MEKLYDVIYRLLLENPELRNSDKKLMWAVWSYEIGQDIQLLSKAAFLGLKSPETIRRTRQKVFELHPELKPCKQVSVFRNQIQKSKGTFIFREKI